MRGRCIQIGDKRTKKRFLIFPKVIGKEWRWIEIAEWEEEYKVAAIIGLMWFPTKWMN